MHVGIDITSILYGRGVSRYTANLVHALARRRDVQLSLYGSSFKQRSLLEEFTREVKKSSTQVKSNVHSYFQSYPPKLHTFLWNTLGQNSIRSVCPNLDVFHSWDWIQPPDKDLPLVSTIHDLAILKFPETAHPDILKMHQKSWKVLKERDAEIIAVSYATKKDIVELLEIPSRKVHVVYEALPSETEKVAETLSEEEYDQVKNRMKLDKPFILFVGTREPRKNLERLIQAWEPLSKDYQLIIAGEKGWDATGKLEKTLNNPDLRFLGRVSNKELVVLYEEAAVFAYPSLYEGFGLPILEAFYHGTPVVTTAISSMSEVAGNAAEGVDPTSVESIRSGIEKVLKENREEQQKRTQRMIIRLHQFSWNKVAEETVAVYQRAYDAKNS